MRFRTGDAPGFPINHKARRSKSLPLPRLPVGVSSDRANDLHVMHGSSRHEDARINRASIHQMLGWEQVALSQVSVDRLEQLGIGNRCIRRRHVGDKVGVVFFTGFREMNLVARPSRCPLDSEARFHIMGGLNQQGSWRQVIVAAPLDLTSGGIKLLDPDPAKDLQSRNLPQPGWSCRICGGKRVANN